MPTPIDWMTAAEFAATGSASTRAFHAFVFGKTVQLGAPGSRRACALEPVERERGDEKSEPLHADTAG